MINFGNCASMVQKNEGWWLRGGFEIIWELIAWTYDFCVLFINVFKFNSVCSICCYLSYDVYVFVNFHWYCLLLLLR